jgi:hypothetical protein
MMSIIYAECHLRRMSLMPNVTYAECHLCRMPLMPNATYAECHFCRMSLMLSVTFEPCMLSVVVLNVIMLSVVAPRSVFLKVIPILGRIVELRGSQASNPARDENT